METKEIKLNYNCSICNRSLLLNEELAHTYKGVIHLKCYKQQTLKDELEFLIKANKLLPFSKGLRMIEERIKELESLK